MNISHLMDVSILYLYIVPNKLKPDTATILLFVMTSDTTTVDPLDLPICTTCGTQFSTPTPPTPCPICDDPRQYLPPTGYIPTPPFLTILQPPLYPLYTSILTTTTQKILNHILTLSYTKTNRQDYTTLRALRAPTHEPPLKNILSPLPSHHPNSSNNNKIYTLHTTPKHCIGQRAFLLLTPHGNILWDCIPYLDPDTITNINALGGISAIIISHPHYYATHLVWAEAFNCPVYLSAEDREWVMREEEKDDSGKQRQIFWDGQEVEVLPGSGVIGVKTGGHFPGSSVLWWKDEKVMFFADTIGTIPSGVGDYGDRGRREGTASYTFMWSYPNMVRLPLSFPLSVGGGLLMGC